ncbi:MAG: DNA polymerase III subunit epsilon [Chloroflexi bacterium]|nr:exonuclease domain-containing protein [Chloroflexota bacterium]MQC26820.1 DNA polymerase III subunit epsilon [Chloroflexota bacterium]
MPSIVAVDIETTGLDPKNDAIIEIGAVRFEGKRTVSEWSTLVNPGRPISPFITQLTGITNDMVRGAPPIGEVLDELGQFVGDAPVLGQRVSFDLSFLRRQGVLKQNDSIDTYDMAAVLLPRAGRYNLGALGKLLNIPLPATHRALDDARVTVGVFQKLSDKMQELPIALLAEIVRLGEQQAWGGEWAFKEALKARASEVAPPRPADGHGLVLDGPIYQKPAPADLQPRKGKPTDLALLDAEEAAAPIEYGGAFSKQFEEFEYRPQQVEMLKAVTRSLSDGRHLMVEAGTGTGKSMAYLLPAAQWAVRNDTRVVISTNTINLQDQLIHKDIPDLAAALGEEINASVLKGRNNYLCPRRLEAMRRLEPESADGVRVLAKVMVWLQDSETGDRADINLTGPAERAVWGRLSANDENCGGETCVRRMGGICPFHRAHQSAQTAHLLVVNHALLLADVATGNRVLPDYEYLIVDEAHHMESATTSALSFRLTQPEAERTLRDLGGANSGLIGRILVASQDILQPSEYAALEVLAERATDKAFQFQNQLGNVFTSISQFLEEEREGRPLGDYAHQERILASTRVQPAWLTVEMAWEEAQKLLEPLIGVVEQIGQGLSELVERGNEEAEDFLGNLGTLYRSLKSVNEQLNALVFEPREDFVYWVEIRPNRHQLILQAAPLHIGHLMEEHIWHPKSSVILTSATLTAAGDFDYIRRRLQAVDADELALGSPFDYENAALLYLPEDIPEPAERHAYQSAVERTLTALAKAANGRTLALFTSYAQLRRTSQAIAPRLAEADIQVYEQGEGASSHALLENFKSSEAAILLGTRAFWEGVDIPGDALSVLAIVRLPFDVPTDPIVAARSETFESPFFDYQVPEAILRFRQGFGRLIRTQSDRGVVVVLDKRLLTKSYGSLFIDSLPQCTIKRGRLSELPLQTTQWLGL